MRTANGLRRLWVPLSALTICLIGPPRSELLTLYRVEPGLKDASGYRVPVVEDWTHRHVVYSAPRGIIQSLELRRQTRYIQQYLRRYVLPRRPRRPIDPPVKTSNDLQRDWGISAGSGATMGEGNFPAKYVFNVNATPSCTADYVVFTTNLATTTATTTDIYGVNNLYVDSGGTGFCSGKTNPTVMWAYHIQTETGGNGGSADTSPVLSLDGTQIAWVEGGGGTGVLHLLKPYTGGTDGTLAAANAPTNSANGAAYRSCTPAAPALTVSHACLYSLAFANGDDDTGDAEAIAPSSPYYDYDSDTMYVGDDGGNLHKFTGVFAGSPAEVTTGGWPVTMTPVDTGAQQLGSPVLDQPSGNVFVGDNFGNLFFVRLATTSLGTCNAASNGGVPPCVGSVTFNDGDTSTTKIAVGPIVDSNTQRLFVFFSPAGGGPGAYVGQNNTSLSLASPPLVNVGEGTAHRLNDGALDELYYSTDNQVGQGTGWMYVCGSNTTTNAAVLERIAVTNGAMNTALDSTTWAASSASARCDPLTEFYNANMTAPTDYLFFGVEASGATGTNCAGNGCIFAVTVTGGTLNVPPASGTGAVNASGGTSGIIVDNDGTQSQASSLYFTWLANGTGSPYTCNGAALSTSVCAVKLTQSGLN
jgi:hypothetical protein